MRKLGNGAPLPAQEKEAAGAALEHESAVKTRHGTGAVC